MVIKELKENFVIHYYNAFERDLESVITEVRKTIQYYYHNHKLPLKIRYSKNLETKSWHINCLRVKLRDGLNDGEEPLIIPAKDCNHNTELIICNRVCEDKIRIDESEGNVNVYHWVEWPDDLEMLISARLSEFLGAYLKDYSDSKDEKQEKSIHTPILKSYIRAAELKKRNEETATPVEKDNNLTEYSQLNGGSPVPQ